MHKYITVLLFTTLTLACQSEERKKAEAATDPSEKASYLKEVISTEAFAAQLKADPEAQLIDVRTPEEYAEGHLEGSTNLNYFDDDFEVQLQKLDKTKTVMVYCKSGGRSGKAAAKLQSLEFQKIFDMEGGYTAWAASKE